MPMDRPLDCCLGSGHSRIGRDSGAHRSRCHQSSGRIRDHKGATMTTITPATPDVGAQFHAMWTSYTDAQRIDVLNKLQACGMTTVRIDVSWAMLQPPTPRPTTLGNLLCGQGDRVVQRTRHHPADHVVADARLGERNAGEHVLPTNAADYARVAQVGRGALDQQGRRMGGVERAEQPRLPGRRGPGRLHQPAQGRLPGLPRRLRRRRPSCSAACSTTTTTGSPGPTPPARRATST